MPQPREYILTLSCDDVRGIVAAVAGFVTVQDGFILESTQYGDPTTNRFFMRVHFACGPKTPAYDALCGAFRSEVGERFKMRWEIYDTARKPRVLILVSKYGHCLNDLLHRYHSGTLKVEIPAVISNHKDMESLVAWHQIPYYYIPINNPLSPLGERVRVRGEAEEKGFPPPNLPPQAGGGISPEKSEQEARVLAVIEKERIDLVVLARYMQILSPELCKKLEGRAINIHHSFLPSFKGAKPYTQAHTRGVKIIGATAHYVTEQLDEGPIIEQEVARVNHTMSPEDLEAVGRDIESRVLARAIKYHIERRVLLNGSKTVVFG